jgi:SAM-dependent methyltransferase
LHSDLPRDTERLRQLFGQIDIYLFDQLLRGNVTPGMRVLDAGCGGGRNLFFLLRAGYDAHGVDRSPDAVLEVQRLAAELAPALPDENFQVCSVAELPYPDGHFDAVLSSAVLHFSADESEFEAMVSEMWRVLASGGLFWARLASSIGIEDRIESLGDRRFHLPDGTDRFLVDEELLLRWTDALGGALVDPIKTTNVQGLRCMTTWVVRKH